MKLNRYEWIFVVAMFCLVVSTASAAYWVIGNPLIYHVKEYSISMIGSPSEGDITLNTEITFTITLLYGSNPVNGATVYLYDGEASLLSGTTDTSGLCILTYTVIEVRDYIFTPRYLTP